MTEPYRDPWRRQPPTCPLWPLDEDDRVVEVRLERAPVSVRQLVEAVQVEMRDAVVAVADRVRRARDRPLDPECARRPAHERRLPGAELAADVDDVAGRELGGEARRDRLGFD